MTPEQIRAYNAYANSHKKIFYHFLHKGHILENSRKNHINKARNLLKAFNKPLATYVPHGTFDPYSGAKNQNAKNIQNAHNLYRKLQKNLRLKVAHSGLVRVQANSGGNLVHLPQGVIRHILKLM